MNARDFLRLAAQEDEELPPLLGGLPTNEVLSLGTLASTPGHLPPPRLQSSGEHGPHTSAAVVAAAAVAVAAATAASNAAAALTAAHTAGGASSLEHPAHHSSVAPARSPTVATTVAVAPAPPGRDPTEADFGLLPTRREIEEYFQKESMTKLAVAKPHVLISWRAPQLIPLGCAPLRGGERKGRGGLVPRDGSYLPSRGGQLVSTNYNAPATCNVTAAPGCMPSTTTSAIMPAPASLLQTRGMLLPSEQLCLPPGEGLAAFAPPPIFGFDGRGPSARLVSAAGQGTPTATSIVASAQSQASAQPMV